MVRRRAATIQPTMQMHATPLKLKRAFRPATALARAAREISLATSTR